MKNQLSGMAAVLLAVLTLMIGFGLGVAFGSGSAVPPEGPTAPAQAWADPGPSLESGGTARSPAPRRQTAAMARGVDSDIRVSDAEFERARARIEVPEIAADAGEGVITGRVSTELGEPLADAVVIASHQEPEDPYGRSSEGVGSGAPIDPALEASLRSSAQNWAARRGRRLRAVTEPDGSYRLAGLPVGNFLLRAYHPGYVLESVGNDHYVQDGGSQDFLAKPVFEVQIDVREPDGSQPDVAAIRLETGRRTSTLRWTPEEPVLRLSAAEGSVTALADFVGGPRYGSEAPAQLRSAPHVLDGSGGPVRLELRQQRGIFGHVEGPDNGFRRDVRLLDLATTPDISEESFKASGLRARMRRAVFEFLDLAPGAYALGLLTRHEVLLSHVEVVVEDGLVEQVLEIPEPTAANSIRVTCLNPQGETLGGVRFDFTVHSGNRRSSSSLSRPRRDTDGAYLLPLIAMGLRDFAELDGEDEFVQVTAQHPRFGACSGKASVATRELTLRFQPPCSLTVTLTGYAQHPERNRLRVLISSRREAPGDSGGWGLHPPQQREWAELDAAGTAVVTGLAPGPWRISLMVDRARRGAGTIGSIDLDLQPGEQQISVPIPTLHDIVVSAPGLKPGTNVSIDQKRSADELGRPGMSVYGALDESRQFVARGLPAGTYSAHANGAGGTQEIVVPGGPYVLEAANYDCFAVAISDAEGVFHRAGLRPGDLVVAINGKAIEGNRYWEVLREEGSKHNVPLTVLRGGQRLTIQGGDHAWYGQDLGGTLTPASTKDR
jgi:hypothetical protein